MTRRDSLGWGLGVVVLAGIIGGALAQTAPPAPVAATTNTPDFSQGFRSFIRMGVPDTSKAAYVKLNYYGGGMSDGMFMYRLNEIQLAGNAWLITENKEGESLLINGAGRPLKLFEQRAYQKRMEVEARSNAMVRATGAGAVKSPDRTRQRRMNDMAQTATWSSADLSRDLAKAVAFLDKKIKAKGAGTREMRYDSFLSSDEAPGMLFLLATFAWQNGKTNEASLLAGRLFTLVGDNRKVIIGALNVMADAELTCASEAFKLSGDWSGYLEAVLALAKKYPAGWRKAGAVRILSERLQARATMTVPPPLASEGLTAEDQQLAAALAMETNASASSGWTGDIWVLPRGRMTPAMRDESAIGRIKARGVQAMPMLIAMIPDETLCRLRRDELGISYSVSYSSSTDQKPDEERSLKYYNELNRPLSRGELARALLAPLCQHDQNSRSDDLTPEEITELAKQAYATLKSLPVTGLARHFLENGDQAQKKSAITYMLQDDVESNASVIEAFFLAPDEEESRSYSYGEDWLVRQYVEKRREKAAGFVEKYAEKVSKKELPDGLRDNEDFAKRMKTQAETEIKGLRALVRKQEQADLMESIARVDEDPESLQMTFETLRKQKPSQVLPVLLSAAVKSTNVEMRVRILQMLPMLRFSGFEESAQEEMGSSSAEDAEAAITKLADKNRLTIGTNAALWRILLEDKRPMPERGHQLGDGNQYTVGDLAASGIESLYAGGSMVESMIRRNGHAGLRPEIVIKVTRARAEARLAGTPEEQLPKMPSADDVSTERRKAIESAILKATPETLGGALAGLSDSEMLCVTELESENEAIRKLLSPSAHRIATVNVPPDLPAAEAAAFRKLAGTPVTTNAVAMMREFCRKQVEAGKSYGVTLASAGVGKGLMVSVAAKTESTRRSYGYASMPGMKSGKWGLVTGSLHSGDRFGSGIWPVELKRAVGVSATGTVATAESEESADDTMQVFISSMESQSENFESAVETFCKPDEAIGAAATLRFEGVLPGGKGKGSDDE